MHVPSSRMHASSVVHRAVHPLRLAVERPQLSVMARRGACFGVARATGRPDEGLDEEEMRLEMIERSRKRRKVDVENDAKYTARAIAEREGTSAAAEWKEGELFPEGWEDMDVFEKGYNLYMGKRGLLFWANKAAYASVFLLIGGWIVFRFVGPALGLYKVAGAL